MSRYVIIYSLKCMVCSRLDTQSEDDIDPRRGPTCPMPECFGPMTIEAWHQNKLPDDAGR